MLRVLRIFCFIGLVFIYYKEREKILQVDLPHVKVIRRRNFFPHTKKLKKQKLIFISNAFYLKMFKSYTCLNTATFNQKNKFCGESNPAFFLNCQHIFFIYLRYAILDHFTLCLAGIWYDFSFVSSQLVRDETIMDILASKNNTHRPT